MLLKKHWLAGMLLAMCGVSAHAAPIEINIGHVLSETSSYQIGANKFAEIMKERLGDRVKVNVFPAGALGGEIKLVQGVRTGVLDSLVVGQPSLENTVHEYRIFSLPYLFDSQPQANQVMQGPVGQEFLDVLDNYGMIGLGWGGVFERNMASMKSIATAQNAHGKKIRVIQSPGYVEAYKSLGMQATPIAYGELFLALQNGVVDLAELSPESTVADRFVDVVKYYSVTRVHQLPSVFIISKRKFNSLPADIQPIVKEAGREAMKYAVEYQNKMMADAFGVIRDHKIVIEEPELEPFKAEARNAWPGILPSVPDGKNWLAKIEAAKE